MASIPALLALFAGLCFALQAITVERGVEGAKRELSGSETLLAAFVSVVVSMGLFWLIVLARGGPQHDLTPTVLIFVALGVGYPAVFRLLYFRGIDRVGPSIAAATITANPVIAAVLAVLFLGEVLTAPVIVGTLFIVSGGALLQHKYNSIRTASTANGGTAAGSNVDILAKRLATSDFEDILALLGAMAILGSAYVVISYGLSVFPDEVTATAITQTSATVTLGAYLLLFRRETLTCTLDSGGVTSMYMLLFVLAGVFVALAWLGQFFALGLGSVTTVVPIIYVYPLFLVGYAYATARQYPKSYAIVFGILAIVVGATLIEIY